MKNTSFTNEKPDQLVFVIHKHHATNLHFDFRLQIGSVMPSWSIPKGPTLDNTQKRLAMPTTDHAMDYRKFEGVIPEGEYGAGPVMIWDYGNYLPEIEVAKGVRKVIEDPKEGQNVMQEGMEKGEIKFQLLGTKVKGSFALVKTKGFGPKNSWLLIKHNDEFVQSGYEAKEDDSSALTGRTMDEIRGGE